MKQRFIFIIVVAIGFAAWLPGCSCYNGCGVYVRPDGVCGNLYNTTMYGVHCKKHGTKYAIGGLHYTDYW